MNICTFYTLLLGPWLRSSTISIWLHALEYINDAEYKTVEGERKKVGSTLQGLIKAVKSDHDRK